jgi:hemoglobin/transferrin/lactoferrin receptor protein
MRFRFYTGVILAAGPAALAASLASAQTAAPGVTTFDAVTVTATKTPHAKDDVPVSVEVMDAEALEERQPQTMDDIFRTMPGLESSGGPRRAAQDVYIRGVGGQRVLVTIDGARQNFDAGHKGRMYVDPDLLKRVEVLKGPNSSLHGAGAVGGKVSMTTKDATDFLEPGQTAGGQAKFGYATARREPLYSLTTFATPFEGFDVLASGTYRKSGTLQTGGGEEIPYTSEELGSKLVKFGLDVDAHQRIGFAAHHTYEKGNSPINTSTNTVTPSSLADRDTNFNNYTFNYSFEELGNRWADLRFTAYRSTIEVDEVRFSDGRFDESDLTTTGFDLYNVSRPGKMVGADHTLTYGMEFFRDSQHGRRNGAARTEFPGATSDVLGAYVQDELSLGYGVTLSPSLRFDSYRQESDTRTTEQSESQVSPRIGAVWQIVEWAQL